MVLMNLPSDGWAKNAEDGYSEIAGQLQGMKAALEDMRRDYERRFGEMQEKIATLENKGRLIAENTVQPMKPAEAVRGENKDAPGKKTPCFCCRKIRELESNPLKWNKTPVHR